MILNTSTVVDQVVQVLRVGDINYACFLEDVSTLWRKEVIAQLVYEHMDRLPFNRPNNDTNVSGVLRFEFVSLLAESDLLKTNFLQTQD